MNNTLNFCQRLPQMSQTVTNCDTGCLHPTLIAWKINSIITQTGCRVSRSVFVRVVLLPGCSSDSENDSIPLFDYTVTCLDICSRAGLQLQTKT